MTSPILQKPTGRANEPQWEAKALLKHPFFKHCFSVHGVIFVYLEKAGFYTRLEDPETVIYRLLDQRGCNELSSHYVVEIVWFINRQIEKKKNKSLRFDYITFNNGTLNLKTLKLLSWSQQHVSLNRIHRDYTQGEPVIFEKFMRRNFDQETRKYLRAFMWSALIGHRSKSFNNWLYIVGPPGTGKNTFVNIMAMVMGSKGTCLTTLKDINSLTPADLVEKRLILIKNSNAHEFTGDLSTLQSLTDPIEPLGGCDQTAQYKVVITGNKLLTDLPETISHRMRIVRMNREVSSNEREDLFNEELLYMEGGYWKGPIAAEVAFIIRWAKMNTSIMIEHLAYRVPITFSLDSVVDVSVIKSEHLVRWIEDVVLVGSGYKTYVGVAPKKLGLQQLQDQMRVRPTLYVAYRLYCFKHGVAPLPNNAFSDQLSLACDKLQINFDRGRDTKGAYFLGIALKQET